MSRKFLTNNIKNNLLTLKSVDTTLNLRTGLIHSEGSIIGIVDNFANDNDFILKGTKLEGNVNKGFFDLFNCNLSGLNINTNANICTLYRKSVRPEHNYNNQPDVKASSQKENDNVLDTLYFSSPGRLVETKIQIP